VVAAAAVPPLLLHLSPTLVRVHPSSVSLPPLVPVPPLVRACLHPLGCTDSHLLCSPPLIRACSRSVICSFSLHAASVRTRLCPLGCVSVCADPRYPVALVWPSFGLRSRSFAPACLGAHLCRSPLPCYTCLAFVWPSFGLVWALLGFGWSLCVLSGLLFMSISNTQLVHTC
jgi:hypothetical protein